MLEKEREKYIVSLPRLVKPYSIGFVRFQRDGHGIIIMDDMLMIDQKWLLLLEIGMISFIRQKTLWVSE